MAIEQPREDKQLPRRDAESGLAGCAPPDVETQRLPDIQHLQEELRQVRQALAESQNSEQLLAGLFESAMDAIISVDESQCIVLFNPAAERMFGLSVAEAIGQPIDALLPEQAREHHAEHIRTFARTGVSSRQLVGPGCVRGRRANGELFPVEASISQIKVQGRGLFTVILRDISRRIHDEQALRESEERLTLFAATTFEGIVISERGRIIDCNEQFARMMGHTVRELADRHIEELVVPEDRERVADNILRGRESIVEHAMLRKDGKRIFVETHGKTIPVGSPGGRRLTAVRDITERKWIEQALHERTERYELVLAGAQSAIWDWDVPGRRVHFSAQWKALRGFADNEVSDGEEEWSAGIHPEDAARVMAAIDAHFLGKTPVFAEEYRIHCKDGSLKWIADRGIAQRDASGNVVRMAGSESDITERKRIEQALRDSQADLNRAQSVGQIGSWRLNTQRNELHWSDENHRIFGIPKGTPLAYETFLSIIHPDDREYVDRMWMAALRGAPYDIEHRLVVDGVLKWVRERAELEFDEQGRLLGGFGTTQDITGLKQAEQALIEADQRKDEFLAMLAHELRNPLTPIRNAAHVLGRLETQEPRVQWAQQIIERQVGHLTRLVDDLLDVSRIVRGKVSLKMEPVELAAVVNQALDMARPLIDGMQHRIAVRLPEQPAYLEGDPVRLAQVLLNLLDNAAKYTPEGGRIEVEASVVGPVIEIKVRDNGIGIPADLLPQVFDLFQQGERTLDRSQGGLGIGLTLVKRLVEMHGGLLEASSAGEGLGSEFTIWLPVLPGPSFTACQAVDEANPATAHCRVMVVDDDPAVTDSMTVLLQIEGHEVRAAASGEAALELARSFRPQLVLLDIGLQDMDGYAVARQLRAQQTAGEKICLVAVTGYGHEAARARSEAAGFDRHLVKPVDPEILCELLSEIGRVQTDRASGG
ncbi:MAG: PAS domain S-box protein [Gammaproteobacteria bacterium]|nr:PAS domain S-box protein [Gammaproteobacteria bacterium]